MRAVGGKGINVHIKAVKKSYDARNVLNGLDLKIKEGEFVSIVGKSGCGKSTLLRLIAGLEGCDGGEINLNETQLEGLNDQARMMFQDGRLLPWKRVLENVCLGLPANSKQKAMEALTQVGLKDRVQDFPSKLSGGQKQRVALARALVHDPSLLLLDEPLGALDALTRLEMQGLIESLWKQRKFTAILVTHDVEEAVAISDRVVLIDHGKIYLNQPIPLPRPRQRTNPAFSMYVEEILDRIMNRKSKKNYSMILNQETQSFLDSINN
ncbi:ATP-binding cassette domain-containing protein [Oceanobacillus piezotolerans]|uniref:ATP-binding cassette domain-containing protein n=1 Tax=Oceanobacillus piezotolerans TaxID=2448030 RepID=A0A498D4H0_9BACI|nr:ATP-binding cassette domain-containing protein [Oceanobacillus piezotolerans]RLL43736.1 ATP-binding cassette domain-containing protein [Oceanobacillus piezotolerans]